MTAVDYDKDILEIEKILVSQIMGEAAYSQFLQGDIAHKYLDPFIEKIKTLSEQYNFTEQTRAIILNEQQFIESYALYFLTLNYFKLRNLLKKADIIQPLGRALRILDFGCGPGTGALACLDSISMNVDAYVSDQSTQVMAFAEKLIRLRYPKSSVIQSKNINNQKFDLIIAANSLNEITEPQLQDVLKLLVEALDENGRLLILEPALKVKTQNAMKMHDYILRNFTGITPLFPCTHANLCPMLSDNTDDWCHGSMSWNGSKLQRQIDKLTGFNKHRIKYSSFIFGKDAATVDGSRIVGQSEKSKVGFATKICSKDYYGKLVLPKRNRNDSNRLLEKAELHDLLLAEKGLHDGVVAKDNSLKLISVFDPRLETI